MCLAANLSGEAISISKTTAPHAVSYPFSAMFGLDHGHAVSLTIEKFLLFNLGVFSILGLFTIIYLGAIQPNLVKKRATNHYIIINNTVDHLQRLNINFNAKDIKTFLLSTRFLFQSLDRVQFYSINGDLIGDTNILDLDQNVFTRSDVIIEETIDGQINEKNIL